MAQQANIAVRDNAATPVDHILEPNGIVREAGNTEVAHYRENIANVSADAQVSAKFIRQKLPSGVYKITAEVSVPVQEVVTGANSAGYSAPPKVAYVDRAQFTMFVHPRSTIASRQNARRMCSQLAVGMITGGASFTTDTSASELFDKVVFPS